MDGLTDISLATLRRVAALPFYRQAPLSFRLSFLPLVDRDQGPSSILLVRPLAHQPDLPKSFGLQRLTCPPAAPLHF